MSRHHAQFLPGQSPDNIDEWLICRLPVRVASQDVLLSIRELSRGDGRITIKAIAQHCGRPAETVRKHLLPPLERAGVLVVTRTNGKASTYAIDYDVLRDGSDAAAGESKTQRRSGSEEPGLVTRTNPAQQQLPFADDEPTALVRSSPEGRSSGRVLSSLQLALTAMLSLLRPRSNPGPACYCFSCSACC